MHFLGLKIKMHDFVTFSLADIKKIQASFRPARLVEWQKKGYIKKIRSGYYMFTDLPVNEQVLFLVANKIYSPSYISLEMALSIYGFIPEAVYAMTGVTTRKTCTYNLPLGTFIYRHLKPSLFFGYKLVEYEKQRYLLAEPEKAILDYFYLNHHLKTVEDFQSLRINVEEFTRQINPDKLRQYLLMFHSKVLSRRVNKFLKYIKYA